VIGPTQRPLSHNTQHSQQRDIHALPGIQSHSLSSRPVADLRVRASVHAPTKSVSVPASISLLPPVQPGLVYTHTDKIAIGACKAFNFVSDAEQSIWLSCRIGGFIFCVYFISGADDV